MMLTLTKNRLLSFGILILALVVLLFQLLQVWQLKELPYLVIGGLLPVSDPSGYLYEARRLIEFGTLSPWGGRRPIFPVFLAGIMSLVQQNYFTTLIVITVLGALALWLAVIIFARKDLLVGVWFFICIAFFWKNCVVGTFMTESYGLIAGLVSLALLLKYLSHNCYFSLLLSALVLSVGITARVGALFCLISFILIPFLSRRVVVTAWWYKSIGVCAALSFGFILSYFFLEYLVFEPQILFTDFAHTIYGLVVGGQGWELVRQRYPEVAKLGSFGEANAIYRLALIEFINNPLLLLQGLGIYFYRSILEGRIVSFLPGYLLVPFQVLLILGIHYCLRIRRDRETLACLLVNFGNVISGAFLYDAIPRVYAATIPMYIWLSAYGIAWARHCISKARESCAKNFFNLEVLLPVERCLVLGLSSLLLLGPLVTGFYLKSSTHPKFDSFECPKSFRPFLLVILPGQSLTVKDADPGTGSAWSEVSMTDWLASVRLNSFEGAVVSFLNSVGEDRRITYTIDLLSQNAFWVSLPSEVFPKESGSIKICGKCSSAATIQTCIDEVRAPLRLVSAVETKPEGGEG